MAPTPEKTADGPEAFPDRTSEQAVDEKHGEMEPSYPEPTPEEERELLRKIDLTILPMVWRGTWTPTEDGET